MTALHATASVRLAKFNLLSIILSCDASRGRWSVGSGVARTRKTEAEERRDDHIMATTTAVHDSVAPKKIKTEVAKGASILIETRLVVELR